ncbi:unnamed protein product, partial [Arabidopsis halleri]
MKKNDELTRPQKGKRKLGHVSKMEKGKKKKRRPRYFEEK